MRKLFCLLAFLSTALLANAQLRNNAGYDCEEEIFPRYDKATRTYGYVNMVGQWRVEPTFTKAQRFSGKIAVIQQGTKFGLLNCQGRLAASPVYDEIQNFVNGRGWARQGALWGLLDDKGKLVVPPAFEEIRPVGLRNELTWVKKKGVWGVFSKERIKMVVEPKYDACRSISDSLGLGLKGGYISPIYLGDGQVIYDSCTRFDKVGGNTYRFEERHKFGLMEATGSILMRPVYDSLLVFTTYILASKESKWAVASPLGKLETDFIYDQVKGSESLIAAVSQGKKWGYVLASGKPFIPIQYDGALKPAGSYYALYKHDINAWAVKKVDETLSESDFKHTTIFPWGSCWVFEYKDSTRKLLNPMLDRILPYTFKFSVSQERNSYMNFGTGFGPSAKWGSVIINNFDQFIPMEYRTVEHLIGNLAAVSNSGGKWGVASYLTHKAILEPRFSLVDTVMGRSDLIQGIDGEQVTLFNLAGQPKGQIPGDRVYGWKKDIYAYRLGGKFGLAKIGGEILKKPSYEYLKPTGGSSLAPSLPLLGKRKGKAYLIAEDGKEIGAAYDSIRSLGEGYYVAIQGSAQKVLDRSGRAVLEEADLIVPYFFSDGLLVVKRGNSYQFLNRSLKPAFTLPLEDALPFSDGTAQVRTKGKDVRINKQGHIVQIIE